MVTTGDIMMGKLCRLSREQFGNVLRDTILDLLKGIYMDQEIEMRVKIVYKGVNYNDVIVTI